MTKSMKNYPDNPDSDETVTTFSNPLEWWATNASRFPTLATLARKLLCIPATSAPSERAFSTAGLTIAKKRASLLPENAAALIYLHNNWDAVTLYRENNPGDDD